MEIGISDLIDELKFRVELQKLPSYVDPVSLDFNRFIMSAIKRLFIDTGRASVYNNDIFTFDEDGNPLSLNLMIDEEEYVMLLAQIQFFKFIANNYNGMVGYSTNALTVTNADKPYANVKDTIEKLDNERRIVYYKMSRYALGVY